jgi:AcrR family transcriptional regulator
MERNKSPKRMGRPRSFDIDRALDRALVVFSRKGYEGASPSDLTKAVGVNRPSLYAAFGDKEALFRKAPDRYLKLSHRSRVRVSSSPPFLLKQLGGFHSNH